MAIRQGLRARLVRSWGFVIRELTGISRQRRLILTLIVAPFAILLVFGLGYRTNPPPFRTLIVEPGEQSQLADRREELAEAFGDSIRLMGTTADVTEARSRLRSGDVDLLIITPANLLQSLEEGESSRVVIVHGEVDPVVRASVRLIARASIDDLNRRILEEVVARIQAQSQNAGGLADVRSNAESLVTSLSGDAAAERRARELVAQLGDLEDDLDRIQTLDPALLVSPLQANVEDIANLPGTPALFYAPGTMVVLIQHLAVTFAALSVVRERQLGLTELFQASPLTPTQVLIGKYFAFMALSAGVALALTGTMFAFGVTMRGSFLHYVFIVIGVIVASLGLGFVISGFAQNDSQAVQYAMMLLLFSIFFTGLVLPLDQLILPIRAVSFLVPGTYGISGLHDVMFRGLNPDPGITLGLALYAWAAAVGSWWVIRRDVATLRS